MKCFFFLLNGAQQRQWYSDARGAHSEKNSIEFVKKKFLSEKLAQRQNNNHHHNHCWAGGTKKSQPKDDERKKNNFVFYFALGATQKRKLSNDVY